MSRDTQNTRVLKINRIELRCIILRHFGNQRKFSDNYQLNYETLRTYLSGKNMPKIDMIIVKIIEDMGYNPDGSRILPEVSPKIKL